VAAVSGCSWFGRDGVPAQFERDRLVDRSGVSLYTYDRDVAYGGKSVCTAACLETWRPFLAAPGARRVGEFALIPREAGERQWVYRGKPLFRYAGDRAPGDTYGHGADNLWRMAAR
jgi:predicted lipoprotein with Yx(FWY)xxD motif